MNIEHPFMPSIIRGIMKRTADEYLSETHDLDEISSTLPEIVRNAIILSGNVPRYKLVVQCIVAENGGQSIHVASKSLWRKEDDNYASYAWENQSLIVCVMCFGFYFE